MCCLDFLFAIIVLARISALFEGFNSNAVIWILAVNLESSLVYFQDLDDFHKSI